MWVFHRCSSLANQDITIPKLQPIDQSLNSLLERSQPLSHR
jgi:hypothetical protein